MLLIDYNRETETGFAFFADRTYEFAVSVYPRNRNPFNVNSMSRDGVPAINPTRGRAIEETLLKLFGAR